MLVELEILIWNRDKLLSLAADHGPHLLRMDSGGCA